jgi:uncharacterized membrane protein YfbV (UPF0208 family)
VHVFVSGCQLTAAAAAAAVCLLLPLQGVNTGHILKTRGLTKHGCFMCMNL